MLFFGTASTAWSISPVLATIIAVAGIILYSAWTNARTKMIKEEMTLRQLFKNW
jgi:FtsH-binding integral membrane protein